MAPCYDRRQFMKRNWLILVAVGFALILAGLLIKSKLFSRPGPAALQVSSTPQSTVFIDGTQAGITPFFDDKLEADEHVVKLVPEATTDNLLPWEGKVNLTSGILTVINRNFASSESASSGEIISLEKISSKNKAALAVVSIPDQAVVKVNDETKGFAPVLIEDLTPGDYRVTVASPGYEEKTITAQAIAGYKLIVTAKLAQEVEGIVGATPSAEVKEEETEEETVGGTPTPKVTPKPKATPPAKPYVVIKDTPTGWLRVRMGPSTSATEAARVNPNEMFPYLDEEEDGWYKIEYEEDEEGWISGVYADLVK